MPTNVSHFELLPLDQILGSPPSPDARATLLAAGARIEALPSVNGHSGWWVEANDPEPDAPSRVSCAVTAWKGVDDWLEFDIDLSHSCGLPPSLSIDASVGVACMCSTNHNMHWLHRVMWAADSADAAANAVEAAAEVLGRWFQDPGDADRWRTWSGLPSSR